MQIDCLWFTAIGEAITDHRQHPQGANASAVGINFPTIIKIAVPTAMLWTNRIAMPKNWWQNRERAVFPQGQF